MGQNSSADWGDTAKASLPYGLHVLPCVYIGLILPGYVCLSVHLLVRLQLSALLYGGRSTYQCVSRRLGETAHSALGKAKSRLQTHPVYTLSICAMLVCMSALCLLLMHPRGRGERATGRKRVALS